MSVSAIGEHFAKTVRDSGTEIAVRSLPDGSTWTFEDLGQAAADVRAAAVRCRLGRGAIVVCAVANGPMFFPIFAAAMEQGLVLIPVGESTEAELTTLIAESGASAIITDRELSVAATADEPIGRAVRILRLPDPIAASQYGESVVLKMTSGSTAAPRAAVASEMHLINDGRHIVEAMGILTCDVNATWTPLSHSYAIGNIVMPLICQGTSAAIFQSFNPLKFVHDVAASGATVFPGVPFMFERIKAAGIERLPGDLRLLITAGARIDPRVVSWFHERLGRKLHSFYGSSETGGITYDDSDEIADAIHVGRAVPETTIEFRDGGRIFVMGNAVSTAYAGAEGTGTSEFLDGGFLTADVGRLDADGRLVLTGRVSAHVNVAGRKVDPDEVEHCLRAVPGVAACTVVAIACETRGQQLAAFIVASDATLTAVKVRQACATALSPHKIPRRILFVDRLPLTERGKVDRAELTKLAENE